MGDATKLAAPHEHALAHFGRGLPVLMNIMDDINTDYLEHLTWDNKNITGKLTVIFINYGIE